MIQLIIYKNYILVTRAGTIGNIAFADNQIKDLIVSEDVLRIVAKNEKTAYYLYAFLCSNLGQKMVKLFSYGSVIQHIESQHIELLPIPLFNDNLTTKISSLVCSNITKIEQAKEKELQAISLVESEIEKWNQ